VYIASSVASGNIQKRGEEKKKGVCTDAQTACFRKFAAMIRASATGRCAVLQTATVFTQDSRLTEKIGTTVCFLYLMDLGTEPIWCFKRFCRLVDCSRSY
jgi:hypothetical protein